VAARLGLERLDRYWPQVPVGIDWFAVGESTAGVLREFGLPAQTPECGQDSEALLQLPRWQVLLAKPHLRVLIWRGAGGREHLASQIRDAGGQVDYLELYQRLPADNLPQSIKAARGAGVRGIVVLSIQALEYWQQAATDDWSWQRTWRCWVPSERVAKRAVELGCEDIIVCNGADDDAVISAIMAHPLTAQGE
jgi:uroporphyrinogen-III synthase